MKPIDQIARSCADDIRNSDWFLRGDSWDKGRLEVSAMIADALRARDAEWREAVRRWFGCPSCGEDHPESSMCPPHEVRTTGQAWFRVTITKLLQQLEDMEAQRNKLDVTCEAMKMQLATLREPMSGADYAGWKIVSMDSASVLIENQVGSRRRVWVKTVDATERKLEACEAERDQPVAIRGND